MKNTKNRRFSITKFLIILVQPKFEGNIGAVARAMKNFSFNDLILVNPCDIGDDAFKRAKHGYEILENAKIVDDFDNGIKDLDYIVATTGIKAGNEKRSLRQHLNVEEFSKKITEINGIVGLVFGREDYGLYNDELKKCDLIVNIPTSSEYPILNLSHAVTILLYELYKIKNNERKQRNISGMEKELLYNNYKEFLDVMKYPEHKRENTNIMFRRIIGRAMLSKWEYHTMMGVFQRAKDKIKDKK